jgi:hypothetical protein
MCLTVVYLNSFPLLSDTDTESSRIEGAEKNK